MSDRAEQRGGSVADWLDGLPGPFVVAVLLFWVAMLAVAAVVYLPLRLLGFKMDGLSWSRYVLIGAGATFVAALGLSAAIVFLTDYH